MPERRRNGTYVTITRDDATPADLFDLTSELLDRLDRLEWTVSCLLLLELHHQGILTDPEDPKAINDTLASLHDWLHDYQESLRRADIDRLFLNSPE